MAKKKSKKVEVEQVNPQDDPQFGMVTGNAGSGKTHLIRTVLEQNPKWGLLTATTGVAARILGPTVPTINSALGFFDLESLEHSVAKGALLKNIKHLRKTYDKLVIDEVSMLDRRVFDHIVEACEKAKMGLILVGDFCQLAPINKDSEFMKKSNPPQWLFQSKHWPKFAANIKWLKSQYRHTDDDFKTGLNLLRAGKGEEAIPFLKKAGVKFTEADGKADFGFDGLTLTPVRRMCRAINAHHYKQLTGPEVTYKMSRWGKQKPEWKEDVPKEITLKVGCRVMVTRNLYEDGTLVQANGDMGFVTALTESVVTIERDDKTVIEVDFHEQDDAIKHTEIVNGIRKTIVDVPAKGGIKYMPVILAWSLTVHKAQGLTVSAPMQVQMWSCDWWPPAMLYVAASRVKDPSHLILTGAADEKYVADHCAMDEQCEQWL